MVIAAHPDDPDFGVGGTAALWTRDGWEFHYVVVTNGAKGTSDRTMTRERLIPMREREQRGAADVLGVHSCTFLGGEDGELEYTQEMLGKIVREIRRVKPFAVFTHNTEIANLRVARGRRDDVPEHWGFINHRDHRNTGTMAVDAVYPTARDYLNFPEHVEEGLETHNVSEVYIWGSVEPNFEVDVTAVVETKIRALTQHVSQFGKRGEDFPKMIRERWVDEDGRFHERFRRIQLGF